MFDSILARVAGVFDKDLLFGSFLPALLFLGIITGAIVLTVGPHAVWVEFASASGTTQSLAIVSLGVGTVVFSYVLSALRPSFLALWSGTLPLLKPFFGLLWFGRQLQRRNFLKLRQDSREESPWEQVMKEFDERLQPIWDDTKPPVPHEKLRSLERKARELADVQEPGEITEQLKKFERAYENFSGEDLRFVHSIVKDVLMANDETVSQRRQNAFAKLDRRFGTLATVRPTTLGNLIEAYQEYPGKRYGMESEIFWTRLRFVVPSDFFPTVQDAKLLLDFALTMATGFLALIGLAAFGGPWLLNAPALWFAAAVAAALGATFFYQLAVVSADRLGELVRASFDLFRLDLMARLQLPRPASFIDERRQWELMSRLAVYGADGVNFPLKTEAPAGTEPGGVKP